jgi:hypothetical protein
VTIVSKHHQAAGAHVWQYQLDRPAPGGTGLVSHGAELPYVFDGLPIFGPVSPPAPLGESGAVSAIANAPVQGGVAQATPVSSNGSGQGGIAQAAPVASNASSATAPSLPAGSAAAAGVKVNPLRTPNLLSASLQAYWVRFAMTGDPNGPGLPRWPEYTRKREYVEFTEAGPIAKRDLRAAQCDLLSRP